MSGIELPEPPIEPSEPSLGAPLKLPPVAEHPQPAPFVGTPPELEPAEPGTLKGLPWYALLILILGFIALAKWFTDFLNWLLGSTVGRLFPGGSAPKLNPQTVTQSLSNSLGSAYASIDAELGQSFQLMAGSTSRTAQALVSIASTVLALAEGLASLERGTGSAGRTAATAARQAFQAQKTATQAQAQTATLAAQLPAALAALAAQDKAATEHITHLIEPELDTLRSRIHELEKGATSAWSLLEQHGESLGADALTAAVGVGLAALGGSWIECEATQLLGRGVCGVGANTIRNLLLGLLDIGALFELCTIVTLMIDAASSSEVRDVFSTITAGIDDLIKCRGLSPSAPLPQTYYARPGVLTAYGSPGALV